MSEEQDAKRYRWLKENALVLEFVVFQTAIGIKVFTHEGGDEHSTPRLDSAIDDAMAHRLAATSSGDAL